MEALRASTLNGNHSTVVAIFKNLTYFYNSWNSNLVKHYQLDQKYGGLWNCPIDYKTCPGNTIVEWKRLRIKKLKDYSN